MIKVKGYEIKEQIYKSPGVIVYRATREKDNQPVIVKWVDDTDINSPEVLQLKNEYKAPERLQSDRIIEIYSFEQNSEGFALVMEDFGADSLRNILGSGFCFSLETFLKISVSLSEALAEIHHKHIIHKDINPGNIAINTDTWKTKIIDFGISTFLSRTQQEIISPERLEGTLAYISPEQTGRMNRSVDYRTDFYSLGATFYEMLAGRQPFYSETALEYVHCHIAQMPVAVRKINPDIPEAVSSIIMKLMAKNAQDRYQSALGLKADLETCLKQLEQTGKIEEFEIGQTNFSDRFLIPQKLYGRDREIKTLMDAFDTMERNGKTSLMTIAGYSGVGKSVLVHEIHKPVVKKRGYFISGKFDQVQRNIPYSALIQAFRELINQVLTESAESLENWKKELLDVLGNNAQVVTNVIPELEIIIGKQPDVPELEASNARNRFNLAVENSIRVFAKKQHPLVIFLDDLQWTDPATLNLLKLLSTSSLSTWLFIIGAYRDNEVSESHILVQTLNEIEKNGINTNQINLLPLSLSGVDELVSDTLNSEPEKVMSLSELVFAKTGGNPFFLEEFLKSLYSEKLIDFNIKEQKWEWDCVQIEYRGFTDNVVELMTGKIQNLDNHVQSVLKLASCIGNKFDLKTLSVISRISQKQAAQSLAIAVNEGLILCEKDIYKIIQHDFFENRIIKFRFAHDRIQQAAYSLIPEHDREKTHYKTGRLILNSISESEKEKRIFEIVNHLNAGVILADDEERIYIARLNCKAGEKAKSSAAFKLAFGYFSKGIGLLNEKNLQTDYDLMFSLGLGAAETSYLTGEFSRAEQLMEEMLQYAKSLTDKSKVYKIRIMSYIAQNRLQEAVVSGLEILEQLGVKFPEKPGKLSVLFELVKTKLALRGKDTNDLLNMNMMSNQNMIAAMQILSAISGPAYISGTAIYPLIVLKRLYLTVKYGNTPESVIAYTGYAVILCGQLNDFDAGYRFGRLGMNLIEKFNALHTEARAIMLFNLFIQHRKEHLKDALPSYKKGYRTGLEYGDLEYACYCLYMHDMLSFFAGSELSGLKETMDQSSRQIFQLKQKPSFYMLKPWHHAVINLIEKTDNPCVLSGTVCNEEELLSELVETENKSGLFFAYFSKAILNYLFYDYPKASENLQKSEKYLKSVTGAAYNIIFPFYDTLVHLALYNQAPENDKKRILKKAGANLKKLKKYAASAPMNCLNKLYLAQAEQARILNQDPGELYEKSIMQAKENGFVCEEAIANELAAQHYISKKMTTVAKAYLQNAHAVYRRWGAKAKVLRLEENYADFLKTADEKHTATKTLRHSSDTADQLDLTSIIKASQALSGEIELSRLIRSMMRIILENAGAERGFFIAKENRELVIMAEGRKDTDEIQADTPVPLSEADSEESPYSLSVPVVRYAERTGQTVVLNNAFEQGQFVNTPYVKKYKPKSV
ncbi:MAG: serine/threonine-protein kinase PknK, partial [Desulfobacterales bacterium]|nr:serine/threonine-protein kinase PknK [Desulfobacterales bacterium]